MPVAKVDGDNLIYQYIQKVLLAEDSPESRYVVSKMLRDLSIWLPVELYRKVPVLLPYVIRDPTCRKSNNKHVEEWGSPDSFGYFRDDNSLIKPIPRRYPIYSSMDIYSRKLVGNGFVACHIWRKLNNGQLSSRNSLTNSFIPNLVWLPRQLSKLTDREGSFAQKYLQSLSCSIYPKSEGYVKKIWEIFPVPCEVEKIDKPNFFSMDEEDILVSVNKVERNLKHIRAERPEKLHCSRYIQNYVKLANSSKAELRQKLSDYLDFLEWSPSK